MGVAEEAEVTESVIYRFFLPAPIGGGAFCGVVGTERRGAARGTRCGRGRATPQPLGDPDRRGLGVARWDGSGRAS